MPTFKVSIPWWSKLLLVVAGFSVLIIVMIYLLSMASTVRWERYAASLRQDGQPLTFEEIEQLRKEIPDEINGALLLTDLADEVNLTAELGWNTDRGVLIFGRDKTKCNFFEGISHYRVEASRAFLAERRDVIEKLFAIRDRPAGRTNFTLGALAFQTDIYPNMGATRVAGKLAYLESIVAIIDGDVARAIDSTRVLANISSSLNEYPTVIGRLVQIAIDALVKQAIENTLRTTELDGALLLELVEIVDRRIADSTMKWAILGERALFLATCEDVLAGRLTLTQIIADNVNGPSLPILPDFLIRQNQAVGVELLTRLVEAADDPQALTKAANEFDMEIPSLPMRQFLVKMFIPSLSRAVTIHLRITSELQCARLALAAERFRMNNGRLPVSLDELVPEYVDEIPADPFDGAPIRFAETEQGIVIYSIDEDRVDDGGIVERLAKKPYIRDSGFRLLRPEHRGVLLTDEPPPDDD